MLQEISIIRLRLKILKEVNYVWPMLVNWHEKKLSISHSKKHLTMAVLSSTISLPDEKIFFKAISITIGSVRTVQDLGTKSYLDERLLTMFNFC